MRMRHIRITCRPVAWSTKRQLHGSPQVADADAEVIRRCPSVHVSKVGLGTGQVLHCTAAAAAQRLKCSCQRSCQKWAVHDSAQVSDSGGWALDAAASRQLRQAGSSRWPAPRG